MAGRVLDRIIIDLCQRCCQQLWGFTPRMIAAIVANKGPLPAAAWFLANMPRYLMTLHVLGGIRTHLAGATISLANGCLYCAFGQLYAIELIYLRDHGRLFPLDARLVADWLYLDRRELRHRLRCALQEADLHAEAAWVDLTLAFLDGEQEPIDESELRLAHLVRMISETNRIAVLSGVSPDGPQNPVNKDSALKARHAELRRAALS